MAGLALIITASLAPRPVVGQGPEPALTADERGAIEFCQGFAAVVQQGASDCDAMGRALDAFIAANTAFVTKIAHLDSDAVGQRCTIALGDVAEPLMACAETPTVAAALSRLTAIEEARLAQAEADNDALERTCDQLRADLAAAAADCASKNEVLTRFAATHPRFLGNLQDQAARAMDDAHMKRAGKAVAVCFEAMLSLPAECRGMPAFQKALEGLQ